MSTLLSLYSQYQSRTAGSRIVEAVEENGMAKEKRPNQKLQDEISRSEARLAELDDERRSPVRKLVWPNSTTSALEYRGASRS